MHLYLTQEGLESISADYKRQMDQAETFNDIRRAEGAKIAIDYLLAQCYPAVEESVEAVVEI